MNTVSVQVVRRYLVLLTHGAPAGSPGEVGAAWAQPRDGVAL